MTKMTKMNYKNNKWMINDYKYSNWWHKIKCHKKSVKWRVLTPRYVIFLRFAGTKLMKIELRKYIKQSFRRISISSKGHIVWVRKQGKHIDLWYPKENIRNHNCITYSLLSIYFLLIYYFFSNLQHDSHRSLVRCCMQLCLCVANVSQSRDCII